MYFFSEEYRLNMVLDQVIEELSITNDDILISLKNGTKILNGSKLEIQKGAEGSEVYFDNSWKKSDDIHKILDQRIVSICQTSSASIKLILSSHWKLVLSKNDINTSLIDVSFNNYQAF